MSFMYSVIQTQAFRQPGNAAAVDAAVSGRGTFDVWELTVCVRPSTHTPLWAMPPAALPIFCPEF